MAEVYKVKYFDELAWDNMLKIYAYVVCNEVVYGWYVYTFVLVEDYNLEKSLPVKVDYPIKIDEDDEQIKKALTGAIRRFEKVANTTGKRVACLNVREIDREEVWRRLEYAH